MINKNIDISNAPIQKWKQLKSTVVFEHPRMTLAEDDVELPTGKAIKYLHQVYKGNGGVIVICIKDGKLLLQHEYSYPVNEVLYQFPGGRIEDKETYEEAATRELAEKSNFAIDNVVYLGWFYPDNRRTNAKLHVVFSDHVTPDKEKLADDTEFINTIWLSVDEFNSKLKNGEITNYAVLSAWALLMAQLPDLSTEKRR